MPFHSMPEKKPQMPILCLNENETHNVQDTVQDTAGCIVLHV